VATLSAVVLTVGAVSTALAEHRSPPGRQVLLVLVPGLSYEEALGDPVLRALAAAGGVGLMTSSGGAGTPARTAVSVGAGASADDAPGGPVPWTPQGDGLVVEVDPYVQAAGDAVPGSMGSALSDGNRTVAYLDDGAGSVALLAAMDRAGRIPLAVAAGSEADIRVAADVVETADMLVTSDPALVPLALERTDANDVLVLVAGIGVSGAMRGRGDTVAPIVLARGSPEDLLTGQGLPAGLTSDTTRRDGLVADIDVAPTVLGFLQVATPEDMAGSPLRRAGNPPTDLHERYLEHQRIVGPTGQVLVWFAIASLVAGLLAVFGFRRPHPVLARGTGLAILASIALMVAMVPASLVRPAAWAVASGLALVAAVVVWVAVRLGRRDPRVAVSVVAVAGLVAVALDRLLGWPSLLTPLLGGGALDGERFFGLGNAYAGFVLAGTVLWAARLSTGAGVALIAGGSAFAGLPFLGTDLGGGITLAIAAALWFGLRWWRGFGWRTWALAAAAGLGALVFFTFADRLLPGGGTHLSSVTDGASGPLGQAGVFVERLAENVRTTSQTPAAWLAILGLPLWLAAALRKARRLEPTLGPDERWRDAVVVLALAGIAGYLVNDTQGMAGVTFAFLSTAMLYPTLAALSATRSGVPRA